MDPHFLTISTTKTREMWFNKSGGMLYLQSVFDDDNNLIDPTWEGEVRFAAQEDAVMFPIVIAVEKNGTLEWTEVAMGLGGREQGSDGLPYWAP